MDLPTYTSIWRIEKRLYKLYDFRLPMPLPIGQVTIFVAIAVPYVGLLTLVGVPFNHTLIWLYILPPGAATWLVTRPVLESKRLPELVKSQLRYLAEPRILCRMAPLAERDVVVVIGKVWRPRAARMLAGAAESAAHAERADNSPQPSAEVPVKASAETPAHRPAERPSQRPADTPSQTRVHSPADRAAEISVRARQRASWPQVPAAAPPTGRARAAPAAIWPSAPARTNGPSAAWPAARSVAAKGANGAAEAGAAPVPATAPVPPAAAASSAASVEPASTARPRPVVRVIGTGRPKSSPPAVERAIAGPSARRAGLRARPVSVVPGGHRPGKPDMFQRDWERVQLPVSFRARIIVLGCTAGAGQTTTALLVGEVLASLRTDSVAVLDLNPGSRSASSRAAVRTAVGQTGSARSSRLNIIGVDREARNGSDGAAGPAGAAEPRDPADEAIRFESAARQHDFVIADPSTVAIPRLLAIADQLILVAPAGAAAPGAITMTFEWLDAHGQHDLAARSILVMNGVSRRSVAGVEQAERVCAGRCRALLRVPWDDQVQNWAAQQDPRLTPGSQESKRWTGILDPATTGAYTALAGVLVASLHDRAKRKEQVAEPAGQAGR